MHMANVTVSLVTLNLQRTSFVLEAKHCVTPLKTLGLASITLHLIGCGFLSLKHTERRCWGEGGSQHHFMAFERNRLKTDTTYLS